MSIPVTSRDRPPQGGVTALTTPLIGPTDDAVRFCVMRLIDHTGPLSGMDVASELTPMLRLIGRGAPPPILPLLHRLLDEGMLTRSEDRPPRYDITVAGRDEAARLAPGFRATVEGRRSRFEARIAILFAADRVVAVESDSPGVAAASFGPAGGSRAAMRAVNGQWG